MSILPEPLKSFPAVPTTTQRAEVPPPPPRGAGTMTVEMLLAQRQALQARPAPQDRSDFVQYCRPPAVPPGSWDKSAGDALRDLNAKQAPISADDLTDAIENGTKDADNQTAGTEYADFAKWAGQNQGRLSPEAKQVMQIYEKHAMAALQQGHTGLTPAEHQAMITEMRTLGGDPGARDALAKLDAQKGPISGEDMAKTLEEGTKDLDGQAAGSEFREFSNWAAKNQERLTPEAKKVLETYKKFAGAAQANGQSGIPQPEYEKMLAEVKGFKTYTDDSARAAIGGLDKKQGPISGEDLTKAIEEGTKDLDGQAAGTEYADFAKWARLNQDRLSPEAKQVLAVYDQHAKKALEGGATGLQQTDFDAMIKEMHNVTTDQSAGAALEKLDAQKGPISGEDMTRAIKEGTEDLDDRSAGKEFDQFAQWAKANEGRLTPEAKQVLVLYKQAAGAARAAGKTGIPLPEYNKMLGAMGELKTYRDDSVRAELDKLNKKDGKVSGFELLRAIDDGTKDLDNQAAGTEYADFAKWAGLNKDRLSPEAQKVLQIYEKHSMKALQGGHTGLSTAESKAMFAEMRAALMPPRPAPVWI